MLFRNNTPTNTVEFGDQMTPEELKTLKAITELARLYMDDYPFQLPVEDVAIVVDAENLLTKYGVK